MLSRDGRGGNPRFLLPAFGPGSKTLGRSLGCVVSLQMTDRIAAMTTDLSWIVGDNPEPVIIYQPDPDLANYLVASFVSVRCVRLGWIFGDTQEDGEDILLINEVLEEREDFMQLAELIHFGELVIPEGTLLEIGGKPNTGDGCF